ncbi:MAG TPA: AraC family transcriptional regulator [Puia sp.]|nr:AraC family transcriptional regulator [Puia sp.]
MIKREDLTIFHLPQDIFPGKQLAEEPIILYEYASSGAPLKGRSVLHKHAVSLVIKGNKTMRFAERTVNTGAGEFHFLSSGNCLVSMELSGQEDFRSILIFFDDSVLADFYSKYAAITDRMRGDGSFSRQGYISFQKDGFIHNYIESLRLLLHSGGSIPGEMKLLKFEELMLHLLEKHPDSILSFQPARNAGPGDIQIRRAVESNITGNITVEELAFLCNLSLSTFKRRFEKIYGSSPSRWILLRRMEIAKDLLLHHHEKPGEIWHKIGYETHSSFTQSFKQVYGLTPKDFQQQKLNVPRQELDRYR